MNGRVGVTVVIVAILLTGTVPFVTGVGATEVSQSQSNPFTLQEDRIDADEVRMDVRLRANGTAEWTLEFWVRLDDNESTTAFESLRDDIREDPENHTRTFAERMTETVDVASNATGREMTADEFDVSTERQSFARSYGVVRYTFDWHGFAAVEGDELRAGDAIEGIYLDDGTRLLIEWPNEYERASVTPDPDEERDEAVIWRGGETDFISGEPRVVVTAAGAGPSTAIIAGIAVGVLGFGAALAWWYRTRTRTADQPIGGTGDSVPESDSGPASGSGTDSGPASGSGTDSGPASGSGTDSGPASGSDVATATATADDSRTSGSPDMELLSNEEQVLRLLRNHDGRMKQQAVVEELGWTDAKTSKVVSGLREEEKLESFRLGRENVLSLPERDEAGPKTKAATDNDGDETE
ncbi:DUF7345 domain-containing protein [Natrinema halophilum]|uniref:Transmembrane glycoprotein / HTH domain protein n=1 Tax=Natrinema halophilum TaxID=1699371 RepID=A0A7D5GLT4_9EURY|nr:hypothetical protein [Natrinema halophilum]QLG49592.1 hypothetical protein HYG82_12345 [Natrinema halophilum]